METVEAGIEAAFDSDPVVGVPGLRVNRGNHLAVCYRGENERDRVLRAYFEPGLRAGHRCVCLVDAASASAVRGALAEAAPGGFDPDQLRVVSTTEVPELRTEPFDPHAMAGFWQREAEEMAAGGYPFGRLAGVMTWTERNPGRLRHLAAFESDVHRVLGAYPVAGWCLYDLERFGAGLLLDAVRTHPQVLIGGALIDNPYCLDGHHTDEAGAGLRASIGALQGVLMIGTLMTASAAAAEIARLCVEAARALVPCPLVGLALRSDGRWSMRGFLEAEPLPPAQARQLSHVARRLHHRTQDGAVSPLAGFEWWTALPLRVADRTLGWLMAASPSVPTHPAEVSFLLQALGTQTAAALEAARATAAQRARIKEVEALNSGLEAALTERNRLLEIHDRLTHSAVEGQGTRGIVAVLATLVEAPVVAEDDGGNVLATGGTEGDFRGPGVDLGRIRARLRTERTLVQEHGLAAQPVTRGNRLLASLWTPATALDGSGLLAVALARAATVLKLELAHERELADIELRLRGGLTDELVAGGASREEADSLVRRARRLGVNLREAVRVAVAAVQVGAGTESLLEMAGRLPFLLVTVRNERVVLVAADDTDWDHLRRTVADVFGDPNPVVGVGSVCRDPSGYPRSYREAERALRVATQTGGVVRHDHLGLLSVLLATEDTQPLEGFLRRWLQPLRDHDRTHRSRLVETLTAYLDAGGTLTIAAARLDVHVNTMKYRLRKIEAISGLDLSDPQVRFQLQVATTAGRALELLEEPDRRRTPPSSSGDN